MKRRAVRLMIVPGLNVFDSIDRDRRAPGVVRRFTSANPETLSAGEQARRLGEAWERGAKGAPTDVRLVVHHPRGTTAAFHLGAHAPDLRPEDFEHIHRLWLEVVRAGGPSVHHRDVVRAALIYMEQQLNGPDRDAVVQLVRETARPAMELAAVLRERDFGRVRDMLRNQPASDLAVMLDRPLGRGSRAGVPDPAAEGGGRDVRVSVARRAGRAAPARWRLEEAAALLNNMAPDDRIDVPRRAAR